MRPAWAEINLDNLAFNIRQIRGITNGNSKIMAVVKADAYGHGIVETSRVLLQNGADRLGVAILDEAVHLRERGVKVPIVILGYTPVGDYSKIVEHNLIQTIFEYRHAEILSQEALRNNVRIPVHVKIDTGMGRLGFLPVEGSIDILAKIMDLPGIYVEGIYTHFANADALDPGYTQEQLERFLWFLDRLEKRNIRISIRHAANSAGILNFPQAHLDMVRPGIVLYGMLPSAAMANAPQLKPVMSLKAKVASVKHMPAGSNISYGCTCKLEKNCVIAVLPLGYADGYTRHFSNNGFALVGGHRVPLLGRVCMDQVMVDVSGIPNVAIGDEAVLLGRQQDCEITAEELALLAGTINYEIVCMISHRVPRIYVK
jgi:alanine racemase